MSAKYVSRDVVTGRECLPVEKDIRDMRWWWLWGAGWLGVAEEVAREVVKI